jgi:hypothetical protein
MSSTDSKVRSAASAVALRNSRWVWSLTSERDLPKLSSWLVCDSDSMSSDLKRDPSSEASSRASLSLFSCNFRRKVFVSRESEKDFSIILNRLLELLVNSLNNLCFFYPFTAPILVKSASFVVDIVVGLCIWVLGGCCSIFSP